MPDITIAGATFRNVPQIDVPKDGGGSASFIYEEGTKQINTNGTHDVSGYLNAQVSVPSQSPVINPLSVTENGTYTAPSGVDGYSPVTVNVSGGGGSLTKATKTASTQSNISLSFTGLAAEPKWFIAYVSQSYTPAQSVSKGIFLVEWLDKMVATIEMSGTQYAYSTAPIVFFGTSRMTATYENGTLTLTITNETALSRFMLGLTYKLVYLY